MRSLYEKNLKAFNSSIEKMNSSIENPVIAVPIIAAEMVAVSSNISYNQPLSSNVKEIRLTRYFESRNKKIPPEIYYDIEVTFQEYKPGKFHIMFEIEQDGEYKSKKEYFFEGISKMSEQLDDNDVEFEITFINGLSKEKEIFCFDRFNYEDINTLKQLLYENVINK